MSQGRVGLVADAAPDLVRIDLFVRIERACSLQQNLSRLRISGVCDAAIIDRTDGCALRLIEMPYALGAAVMGNDIDVVANTLTISDMIPLCLCVAAGFENRFIRALGKTGPAGNAFFGNQ